MAQCYSLCAPNSFRQSSVFQIYRQSWSLIFKIFKFKLCKRRMIFELLRVLPACLNFTVTNMNGIEIIVHLIYAFFGEKRQADRAFSIHIYRYEIKAWAGV